LIALTPLSFTPLLVTSCVNVNSIAFKYYGIGEENYSYADGKATSNFKKLYEGDKKINDGNYVILLGSTGKTGTYYSGSKQAYAEWNSGAFTASDFINSPSSKNSLVTYSSNVDPSPLNPNCPIFTKNIHSDWTTRADQKTVLQTSIENWEDDGVTKNYSIPFLAYFCQPEPVHYINGAKVENIDYPRTGFDDPIFYCDPFKTWTQDDYLNPYFNQFGTIDDAEEKKKNQNSWEQHHQIGDYVRQDKDAKEYRAIINFLHKVSPNTFGDKDGLSSLITIFVKDGRPNRVGGFNTISSDLNAVFTEETLDD